MFIMIRGMRRAEHHNNRQVNTSQAATKHNCAWKSVLLMLSNSHRRPIKTACRPPAVQRKQRNVFRLCFFFFFLSITMPLLCSLGTVQLPAGTLPHRGFGWSLCFLWHGGIYSALYLHAILLPLHKFAKAQSWCKERIPQSQTKRC